MSFLPIVDRELRTAARRPGTYRVRSMAALAVMIFGFATLAFAPASAPLDQVSKTIFALELVIAFGFCLMSGVFLTADCLSVEKREGTLGLLFLTDLSGFDVVLGKLAATSIQSIYGLLAIFPVLGLPLLMGGVSSGEFVRALLALFLTLLLSLAIGLLVSAVGRETRQTMGATFGILVVLAGVLPVLAWLEHVYSGNGAVVGKWFLPSPVGALMLAFDWSYRTTRGAGMFWTSIGLLSVSCLGALTFAGLFLPRTFREEKSESAREGKGSIRQRMRFRDPRGPQGRCARLERNPFHWLAARDRLDPLVVWCAVGFVAVLWLCFVAGGLMVGTARSKDSFGVSFLVAFALHALFKALVALEASRRLSDDRHSGALELLLATPLPPRMILRGQWLALREQFWWPLLAVLLVNVTLISLTGLAADPMSMGDEERTVFRAIFLGGALLLLLDFRALSWMGMLMALRSKSHTRAVLSTLGRVLVLPWAGIFAFVMIGVAGRGLSTGAVETFVFLWFLAGTINSLSAAATARRRLLSDFRTLASGVKGELRETSPAAGLMVLRGEMARTCV